MTELTTRTYMKFTLFDRISDVENLESTIESLSISQSTFICDSHGRLMPNVSRIAHERGKLHHAECKLEDQEDKIVQRYGYGIIREWKHEYRNLQKLSPNEKCQRGLRIDTGERSMIVGAGTREQHRGMASALMPVDRRLFKPVLRSTGRGMVRPLLLCDQATPESSQPAPHVQFGPIDPANSKPLLPASAMHTKSLTCCSAVRLPSTPTSSRNERFRATRGNPPDLTDEEIDKAFEQWQQHIAMRDVGRR